MSDGSRDPASAGPVFTVSEITAYVKRLLERDELLSEVAVRGEISNFTRHRSGHLYFSLKDEGSQLSCVCFRGDAGRLKFEPEAGLRVIARGSVTVYEPAGKYQLIVRAMQPDGAGALAEALARLRARLEAEGLFEEARKRPLPPFPRRIALVTSPTGAAVRDLVSVISRRFGLSELVVVPTIVQGEAAPESIVDSLRRVAAVVDADLVILARGGGSLEDLWAFNDERVVRAIFACPLPVVSAVGHETDFTLADEVADVRAPTPSAAGEMAVPDSRDLMAQLDGFAAEARRMLDGAIQARAARVQALGERAALSRPLEMLEAPWQRLDELGDRAINAVNIRLERLGVRITSAGAMLRTLDPRVRRKLDLFEPRRRRLDQALHRTSQAALTRLARYGGRIGEAAASLRALDPQRVLDRGYALVRRRRDGLLVRSAEQAPPGEMLNIAVAEGEFDARVQAQAQEGANRYD